MQSFSVYSLVLTFATLVLDVFQLIVSASPCLPDSLFSVLAFPSQRLPPDEVAENKFTCSHIFKFKKSKSATKFILQETQQQRECTIRPGLLQCLTNPPSGSLSTPSHLPSCSFSAYCDFTLSKCTAKGPSLVGCLSLVTWLNHDSFPHLSKQCFLGTQHGGDCT